MSIGAGSVLKMIACHWLKPVVNEEFGSAAPWGDSCLTAVGDKPRRYLYHPLFAHYLALKVRQEPHLPKIFAD